MQHRLVAGSHRPAPVILVIAGAWLVLIVITLNGVDAVRHDRLLQGGPPLWLATIVFVAGWQVMVWAMMAPASLHALDRVGSLFTLGYVGVWTAFGLAIFFADAGLHFGVNHLQWLAAHAWLIPGSTLVLCGSYEISTLKTRSLEACRLPSHVGWRHGLDCVGSSGGLMLLSFALAATNLVAMAAIAGYMVFEVTPRGRGAVRPLGYGLIGLGVAVLWLSG